MSFTNGPFTKKDNVIITVEENYLKEAANQAGDSEQDIEFKTQKEEPLNELSKDTLKSYTKNAYEDGKEKMYKLDKGKNELKFYNRIKGIDTATKKIKKLTKEEPLNELSKNTLKSYRDKAIKQASNIAIEKGKDALKDKTFNKRMDGYNNALSKMIPKGLVKGKNSNISSARVSGTETKKKLNEASNETPSIQHLMNSNMYEAVTDSPYHEILSKHGYKHIETKNGEHAYTKGNDKAFCQGRLWRFTKGPQGISYGGWGEEKLNKYLSGTLKEETEKKTLNSEEPSSTERNYNTFTSSMRKHQETAEKAKSKGDMRTHDWNMEQVKKLKKHAEYYQNKIKMTEEECECSSSDNDGKKEQKSTSSNNTMTGKPKNKIEFNPKFSEIPGVGAQVRSTPAL